MTGILICTIILEEILGRMDIEVTIITNCLLMTNSKEIQKADTAVEDKQLVPTAQVDKHSPMKRAPETAEL